jgi:hypothetical protein
MTVKQLKELLNEYPDDMLVVVSGYEGGFNDISDAEIIVLKRDVHSEWYYGRHEYIDEEESGIDHLHFC